MRGSKLDARTLLLLSAVGALAIATIVATPRWARAQDILTLRGPGSTIGATLQSADLNSLAGATRGAVVGAVQVGSPAATAGIRVGDRFTEFDGISVRDPRHLTRLVAETPPGRTVNVTVVRDGRTRALKVTPLLQRSQG
jgi:serine protease Do